jgi:sugar phosphate isomerase/epimerase
VKPILALSTSWCSHRHQDGSAMLEEIAGLGFHYAELSHGIRITLVPGILKAVERGVIRISSTHNFCPLPTGVSRAAPNLYEPSAPDAREREQWVRHTKRSIDFAAQVKAQVLVCHLGSVRFGWLNPGRSLRKHLQRDPDAGRTTDNRAYRTMVEKALVRLRRKLPEFWGNARASLNEVMEHVRQKGVHLGIENREKFEELPLDSEHAALLESFAVDAPIGYWHDTGHAEIKEAMGLMQHRMHLEKMARRTLGFHLHDVDAKGRDHMPIAAGRIDFDMVSRFWRPEHLLTLELGPRVPVEHVRESKRRLERLLEHVS